MEQRDEDSDYSAIVDEISNMINHVISKDVILTVVEGCDGDLNMSVDAIMDMTSECKSVTDDNDNNFSQDNHNTTESSYAAKALKPSNQTGELSRNKNVSKQGIKKTPIPNRLYFWSDKMREIIDHNTKFNRIMIIIRGAPGSGKSSLAKGIVEMIVGSSYIDYNNHIFSADDYFMVRGKYVFDKYKLSEAHMWNQHQVMKATKRGLSPIIVDNTNIELWEMEPYVKYGVKQGYIIEVLEPSTPWAWNVAQLSKRNTHNVPQSTISRMLDNYHRDITGQILINSFGLTYPVDKTPPVLRNLPIPLQNLEVLTPTDLKQSFAMDANNSNCSQSESLENEIKIKPLLNKDEAAVVTTNDPGCSKQQFPYTEENKCETTVTKHIILEEINQIHCKESENNDQECIMKAKLYEEAQKRLEELQKNELEWELNDSWSVETKIEENNCKKIATTEIKPKRSRRKKETESVLSPELKESINKCDDWTHISMFMSPWNSNDETKSVETISDANILVEKISSSTCMDMGDMDPNNLNNYKVLVTKSRNINEFYIPFKKEKIPEKRMLDKSSMTNEILISDSFRCPNEEKHFSSFVKLFPKVSKAELRDIFDKCRGDVNWAVDIVFDSMANNLLKTEDENPSVMEDNDSELCQCLSVYNIVPDKEITNNPTSETDTTDMSNVAVCSKQTGTLVKKKIKKDIVSDSSMLLKSQIEKNFVISDDHYSEHCLKIKKMRHGDNIKDEEIAGCSQNSDNNEIGNGDDSNGSKKGNQSDEEESCNDIDEFEKVIPVNLGMDFVSVLDNLFGRSDMIYPAHIQPKISLRSSLLNELNALWMESLMNQLEDEAANATKKDEEFARELAKKEAELLKAGKEPAVPDFKEIMDMEIAISLYQKNVDEWKTQQPQDIAAILSREKLCNLFPDISQDTLLELLMAHDNNFQATVEVLLNSMGKTDVLNAPNGVNKFIMQKELKRQEKVLEQEKKALSEVEWPLLTKGDDIDMSTVEGYREEADNHLQRTNLNYNKAEEYAMRGMTQVASFYSVMAAYHRLRYDQANSLAAVSVIQMHAARNPDTATIDLHYLHVREAMESLDIFIDTHIHNLKESQSRGGPRAITLFFITGRGLHSKGGPRIKPATKRRLQARGLISTERNPGLLTTKISADSLLTHQINM